MSIKLEQMVLKMRDDMKEKDARLDKLEKSVTILKRSMSHMERHPASDGSVVVPQTDLPDTLDKLEIGRKRQGT